MKSDHGSGGRSHSLECLFEELAWSDNHGHTPIKINEEGREFILVRESPILTPSPPLGAIPLNIYLDVKRDLVSTLVDLCWQKYCIKRLRPP